MMLTDTQVNHLKALIQYVAEAEARDYQEKGKPEGHIYEHVAPLAECLSTAGRMPETGTRP